MEANFASEDFKIKKVEENKSFVSLEKFDIKEILDLWDAYATKKTATAGFFNLALMSSNFVQLKNISKHPHSKYTLIDHITIVAICLSLVLQFMSGIVMVFLGRNSIGNQKFKQILIKNNDLVTLMVFAIFILNIFINIFCMLE
jgi:hypothetical protein